MNQYVVGTFLIVVLTMWVFTKQAPKPVQSISHNGCGSVRGSVASAAVLDPRGFNINTVLTNKA